MNPMPNRGNAVGSLSFQPPTEGELTRQQMRMPLEHQVDALSDVDRYRHLRAPVQQLELFVLFRSDVDRR